MAESSDAPLSDYDLEDIEESLFDLEDELVEMQGTTIRTFEEGELEEADVGELDPYYTFEKPEEEDEFQDAEEEDLGTFEKLDRFKRSIEKLHEVKPGQLLASDLREDGPKFVGGQYVLTEDGGRRLFAGRVGQVCWQGNTVHVLPIRRVDGNVDSSVGDIRYDGSVFVQGRVQDNRLIEATGNVWVLGGVGKARIKASGDIIVRGGIVGAEDRRVEAGGNLYAQFIENANVKADESIIVDEVIMHSRVDAGEDILLIGQDSRMYGGIIQAGNLIFTNELGSVNYAETEVRMAAATALQGEIEELKSRKRELESKEEGYEKDVQNLLEKQQAGKLEPRDEERLRNFQFELNHIRQDLNQVNGRIDKIKDELNEDVERRVTVSGAVHPGVSLKIGTATGEIDKMQKRTTITAEAGDLAFGSFQEPEIEVDLQTEIGPQEGEYEEIHDMPDLDQVRRHVIFELTEQLPNQEEHLKKLIGLNPEQEIALIDITGGLEGDEVPSTSNDSDGENAPQKIWWGIEVRPSESVDAVKRHYGGKRKDSVKVRCQDPREGVERAAEYFGLSPNDLAIKIIEQGKTGFMGFGRQDYLIRAVRRETLKDQASAEDQLEDLDLLGEASGDEDSAGYIELENTDDGLMLSVYPPEGHGLPVSTEHVREELDELGYSQDIDWPTIEETVEEAQGEPVKIGPRQRDPEIDGTFSVRVNDEETKAFLNVVPPKENGIPVKFEEVERYLEDDRIQADMDRVKEVFEEQLFEEDVIIAEGEEPVDGEDGSFELHFDFSREDEEEEEQVDHREGKKIISVKENDQLVTVDPPTEGIPGQTVYGDEIPAEDGEPIEFELGDNVKWNDDQTKILSDIEGRVRFDESTNKVWVEPVLYIDGDVDYDVGNIDFDGVVIVDGMILDGFSVRAGERIEAGSIGKAQVKSGGDIIVDRGIVGREEGLVEAEGNVFAGFIENGQVKAGGSIKVIKMIMHRLVDAGEYVYVKGDGKRGDIIGGEIRAGKAIRAVNVGSQMSSKSEIEIGIPPELRDRMGELEDQIEEQKNKFEKVKLGLRGLKEEAEEAGGLENLSEQKQDKMEQLSNVAEHVKYKIEGVKSEMSDLQQEIQNSTGGELYVEEGIYAGVKITIQTATLHITESHGSCRFGLEHGEISKLPYKELEIDLERPDQ